MSRPSAADPARRQARRGTDMRRPERYESSAALCPYYQGERGDTIYCEGIAPDTTIALALGKDAKEYKRAFCRRCWNECRVAKMLETKYC